MKPPVDQGIYLLADHLDAALAAGEDLLASELAAPAGFGRSLYGEETNAVATFVNNLKRLEAALAARILQARRCATELPRQEPLVRGVINLFLASTASALALVEHFARLHEGATFDPSYLTPHAVLRSRGLLAPDAAELPPFERVVVTENYLIGGVLRLGEILNVVATTLDTLDNHFDLYLDGAARIAGMALEADSSENRDPLGLEPTTDKPVTVPSDKAVVSAGDAKQVPDRPINGNGVDTSTSPSGDEAPNRSNKSAADGPIKSAQPQEALAPPTSKSFAVKAPDDTSDAATGMPSTVPPEHATDASIAPNPASHAKKEEATGAGLPPLDVPLPSRTTVQSAKSRENETSDQRADDQPVAATGASSAASENGSLSAVGTTAKASNASAGGPGNEPARASEAGIPRPMKKPMTLIEALAALDKSRPPTPPSA